MKNLPCWLKQGLITYFAPGFVILYSLSHGNIGLLFSGISLAIIMYELRQIKQKLENAGPWY